VATLADVATTEVGIVERLRAELAANADPVRAAGQQAYMKSAMPYYGLTTPQQRKLTSAVVAELGGQLASADEWQAAIRALWDHAGHREEWYAAISLVRHRRYAPFRTVEAMPLYRHMIETGQWWDVVDELATHPVCDTVLAAPATERQRMREWALDANMWVRRTAILSQNHAAERTDTSLLRDVIVPNLEHGGRQDFFIRKAIGWALREYSYTDPSWVRAFVGEHAGQMAGLTVREATKRLTRQS
jgi:3-methyladenine DNA glycosylase AlkD